MWTSDNEVDNVSAYRFKWIEDIYFIRGKKPKLHVLKCCSSFSFVCAVNGMKSNIVHA